MVPENLLKIIVPSKTVRDFINREMDYRPTEFEQACMVYHSIAIKDIMELRQQLAQLASNLKDDELAADVSRCVTDIKKQIEIFSDNSDFRHVYLVWSYTHNSENFLGIFYNYQTAYNQGLDSFSNYRIKKVKILTAEDPLDSSITAHFNASGKMTSLDSLATMYGIVDHFTNSYYDVPNIFSRGDIVRDMQSNKIGIVETSQVEWAAFTVRSRELDKEGVIDYTDVEVRVAFLSIEDGTFKRGHVNPVNLEYHTLPNLRSMDAQDKLLDYASKIYRGEGSLDDLEMIRREYIEFLNQQDN